MGALIIQAHYERLEQIAATFGAHAQRSAELRARLAQQADALVDSAWQGEAAQRFHAEMSRELLPALQRLAEALDEAQRVTLQIRDIIRAAEEEAAALFQGDGPAPAPSDEGGGLWGSVGGWVHGGLDVLGLVPGFGEVADGVNALIYLAEGDYLNAGLSAAAMIPSPVGGPRAQNSGSVPVGSFWKRARSGWCGRGLKKGRSGSDGKGRRKWVSVLLTIWMIRRPRAPLPTVTNRSKTPPSCVTASFRPILHSGVIVTTT